MNRKTLCSIVRLAAQEDVPFPVAKGVRDFMEGLPIEYEGSDVRACLFFILIGGKWFPVRGNEIDHPIYGSILEWTSVSLDGTTDHGTSMPCYWAHKNGDGGVSYHWLDKHLSPEASLDAT